MKQKSSTYGLLVLALLVWALIGYRLYKGLKENNKTASATMPEILNESPQLDEKYTLLLDYPPPFAAGRQVTSSKGKSTITRKESTVRKNSIVKEVEIEDEPMEEIEWPMIDYLGLGDKNYKQNETVLLSIDGDVQMVSSVEGFEDIRILTANEDSIKLYYHGKSQIFYNR